MSASRAGVVRRRVAMVFGAAMMCAGTVAEKAASAQSPSPQALRHRRFMAAPIPDRHVGYGARRLPQADDRWFAPDKARHFGASAALQIMGYGALRAMRVRPAIAIGAASVVTASAGVAKEVRDARNGSYASRKDLVWDALGLFAGSGLAIAMDLR